MRRPLSLKATSKIFSSVWVSNSETPRKLQEVGCHSRPTMTRSSTRDLLSTGSTPPQTPAMESVPKVSGRTRTVSATGASLEL
jgi:hypothetical protein